MPLLEIVTEPDIRSPQEAHDYLTKLKSILGYLEVSDCDMEKGSLRCDANISIRPSGDERLGTKVELKNMNTFKGVRLALEHEVKRQIGRRKDGEAIVQETRLWDADKLITTSMRSKEEAKDYRYFPEPDLVPFVVDKGLIGEMRASLPELPEAKAKRYMEEFGLSEYDADLLTAQHEIARYFEECAALCDNRKTVANWIMGDIAGYLNEKGIGVQELGLPPSALAGLIRMIDAGKISGKMAKEVLIQAIEEKVPPEEVVNKKGLSQISDSARIEELVRDVMSKNEKSVKDYRAGKKNALAFLIGQVMKESKGSANPAMVNEIMKKNLGE
jgi:aspartyl-tRNA(Asn)/glutamyl-tRNA(Gln) amidotransferase subunit B